jgi:hypothetical protein
MQYLSQAQWFSSRSHCIQRNFSAILPLYRVLETAKRAAIHFVRKRAANVPGIFQLGLDEHFSIRLISLSRADSTLIERRSPRATRLTYDGSMPNWRATRL